MPQRNNNYKIGRTPGSTNRSIDSAGIKYTDRVLPNFKNIKVIDNKEMIGLKPENYYTFTANNRRPKRMAISSLYSNNPNYTYATTNNEYIDIYKKTKRAPTNNMGTLMYNSGTMLDNIQNESGDSMNYMNANIHNIIETNKRRKEQQMKHEMKENERNRQEELEKSKQNHISLSPNFMKNIVKPIKELIKEEEKTNEIHDNLDDFDDNATDDTDMIELLSDEWSDSDNEN